LKVLITGGTGMIGTALAISLKQDGNDVFILTRSLQRQPSTEGVQAIGWDGSTTNGWIDWIDQMDAVVNLVGERLSNWPWTNAEKKRFLDSRVNGGRALVEGIRSASRRPKVFLQASGINYYGPRGLKPVTEYDERGNDFLGDLCKEWEGSTREVEDMGVRRTIIRSGIVLNGEDGILPIMMLPVKLFVGGPIGRGSQGIGWIHIKDEVAAIRFLLDTEEAKGPFNLTSPMPISNEEFMRMLAKVMKRPYWLRAPAFAMRLALGEMATLVLDGMYPQPARLQEIGFHFQFENAEAALNDLLNH
jgi:uncharacterized protein